MPERAPSALLPGGRCRSDTALDVVRRWDKETLHTHTHTRQRWRYGGSESTHSSSGSFSRNTCEFNQKHTPAGSKYEQTCHLNYRHIIQDSDVINTFAIFVSHHSQRNRCWRIRRSLSFKETLSGDSRFMIWCFENVPTPTRLESFQVC